MQRILGQGKNKEKKNIATTNSGQQKRFYFQRKEKDPNAMDVDAMSVEKRQEMMRKGQCFNCGKQGHLSRDCPEKKERNDKKVWDSKSAATHIRSIIAA